MLGDAVSPSTTFAILGVTLSLFILSSILIEKATLADNDAVVAASGESKSHDNIIESDGASLLSSGGISNSVHGMSMRTFKFTRFTVTIIKLQLILLITVATLISTVLRIVHEEDEDFDDLDNIVIVFGVFYSVSSMFNLFTMFLTRSSDNQAVSASPSRRYIQSTFTILCTLSFFTSVVIMLTLHPSSESTSLELERIEMERNGMLLGVSLDLFGIVLFLVHDVWKAFFERQGLDHGYELTSTSDADADADDTTTDTKPPKKATTAIAGSLSFVNLIFLLRPYFWPAATTSSATTNRLRASLTWVFVILSKTCNVYSPLLIGNASTQLSLGNYKSAVINSVAYCGVVLLARLFKELQSLVYLKVAQAAFVQLSNETFIHLHTLSLDWHLKKKLGDVIRSMDRGIAACDSLMTYLFLWLIPALAECLVVCVVFAVKFKFWPLALTVFYFIFLYILTTVLLTLWRKKFRAAVNKFDNDYHDKATDSLINFETVKYFSGETHEATRFTKAVSEFKNQGVHVQASLSLLNLTQQGLMQLCMGLSLWLSILSIRDRFTCCVANGCPENEVECCSAVDECSGMQLGDFVAVTVYIMQLFQPLNFLGTVYNMIVMALVDLQNLSKLLSEEADIKDMNNAESLSTSDVKNAEYAIEYDNVSFNYPSQPKNLGIKNLTIKMKPGTITGVCGSTGAGKTTISRLLLRFYDVTSGAVKIGGKDVRNVTQNSLRDIIGVVPQDTPLFNDTILYNVKYGNRDCTFEDCVKAAKDAQILDFIASQKDGWDTIVGERGLKLSGGEKQRVAIARCLLKNPSIVLLDEATSALDTVTEANIQSSLNGLSANRTVVVIAHRLGTIRNADQIVVLNAGGIEEVGTHVDLLKKGGKYAEMWNMQLSAASH